MQKISRVEPVLQAMPKRKKVAAYARVSRDTERLAHSLSAQVSYYSTFIQGNPEWEYAGVYADFAVSGTGMGHRDEFRRLVSDCEAGKIDIVLTKSISRFARNTVDLLETVRHLKSLGIEVRFEKEHIHSMSGDGELMLSILASFAQEESRSISENCKWGIRKRFQSGEIGSANKHILGYRYDEEQKKYVIIPEEAETVHWIFEMYLDGISLRQMAKSLNEAGLRTITGCEFAGASLDVLVHNEIYAGDIRRQKSYMADPLTKSKVKNRGELPQYYMADCHEAILDRDTYAKVQAEMERRAAMQNPTYCFTGKIRCGICGMLYSRSKRDRKGMVYAEWLCRSKKEAGRTCKSRNYSERELQEVCAELMGTEGFDEDYFTENVEQMVVQKSGSIDFHLKDGTVRTYETFKLRSNRHEATSADEFDGAEFEKQIENITVLEDGSLEYYFKEGRTAVWQKA